MCLHDVKQAQQTHDITDRIPELLIGQLVSRIAAGHTCHARTMKREVERGVMKDLLNGVVLDQPARQKACPRRR
jgi:hypothetical protein